MFFHGQHISLSLFEKLPTNNWKENPNGESYRSQIAATGSPDLLGWNGSVLAPRVQSVFDEYSSNYGRGDPGRTPLLDGRALIRRARRRQTETGKVQAPERPIPKRAEIVNLNIQTCHRLDLRQIFSEAKPGDECGTPKCTGYFQKDDE